MAPLPCTELNATDQARLLGIARESIVHGLDHGTPLAVSEDRLSGIVGQPRGSFVTLRQQAELRGCVGALEAIRPLAKAISVAAFNAAFRDSRFPPLQETELQETSIEISVLSPLEPVEAQSEVALLAGLEIGVEGLLLEEGAHRATLLPKVWEHFSEPTEFLEALKLKAGLPAGYWSKTLRFHRYRAVSFTEASLQIAVGG
jgi:AmmeMemoRadiSam system protein A